MSSLSLTIMSRISTNRDLSQISPANIQQIRKGDYDLNANPEQAHTSAPEFDNQEEFFERFYSHKQEMIIFAGDLAGHSLLPSGANLQISVDKTDEILAVLSTQYSAFSATQLGSEEVLSSFFNIDTQTSQGLLQIIDQHYTISNQMLNEVRGKGQLDDEFLQTIARLEEEEKQILLTIINQMP